MNPTYAPPRSVEVGSEGEGEEGEGEGEEGEGEKVLPPTLSLASNTITSAPPFCSYETRKGKRIRP